MEDWRKETDRREHTLLAPYAAISSESLGRVHPEQEHPMRTAFQRDRDRIIHTTAFRRLEYKTQVFVNHVGDHYRTRLTHTVEVSQIARSIARALRLNEDLAEAVALAHDLGHPPFGHAGEKVLNDLMAAHGGFEHNLQALRIVEYLERRYPAFSGLNPTWETREGIIKYLSRYGGPMPGGLTNDIAPGLEAQVVDAADEIAYNNHDLDDGLSSNLFTWQDAKQTSLWREHYESSQAAFPDATERILRHEAIRRIINAQVGDFVIATQARIDALELQNISDVRARGHGVAAFSDGMGSRNRELKNFLMERMYRNPQVIHLEDEARHVLTDLFESYVNDPSRMPVHVAQRREKDGRHRMVCDYIAGMTDRFALQQHEKLFGPKAQVLIRPGGFPREEGG
ncbi:MAG: deoxyguanosinetriphosphate triphosphohydrolase [bacterium]|nr:deoxyguanosinetriphosphate triphosphohydrolase [bacterium]